MTSVSEDIKIKARAGDTDAMLAWARACIKEDFPEQDKIEKARNLVRIAESCKADDFYNLGFEIYTTSSRGVFVESKELAVILLKQAAAGNDPNANGYMGDLALDNKSPVEAVGYYTTAVKQGSALAIFKIAILKIIGLAVQKETAEGFRDLQNLAKSTTNATRDVSITASMAKTTLENFTANKLFCLYLLDAQEGKLLCNNDGTCNLDVLEKHFTGETLCLAYRNIGMAPIPPLSEKAESGKDSGKSDDFSETLAKKAEGGDMAALLGWTRSTPEYALDPTKVEKIIEAIDTRMGHFRCFDLGTLFYDRSGNNRLASIWYKKAYAKGDSISAECLARIAALKGEGIAAAEWLHRADQLNSASGAYKYGLCLMFGIGGPVNKQLGLERIRSAASSDRPQSHGAIQARLTMEKGSVCPDCISMFLNNVASHSLLNAEGRIDITALESYFSTHPFIAPPVDEPDMKGEESKNTGPAPAAKKPAAPGTTTGPVYKYTQNVSATAYSAAAIPENMAQQPPRLAPAIPDTNPVEDLNALIGLQRVKDSVKGVANRMVFSKMRENAGLSYSNFNLHFVFSGNPGTGKTTVARILAHILHSVGYLSKGHIVEVSARDLIGEYVGSTAPKTAAKVTQALGGVLFIDEAYSLMDAQGSSGKSYAGECIATLLKMMEDKRSEFVLIVAGYPEEMKAFVNFNPGLGSRFTEYISFPDYNSEELEKIFMQMLTNNEYALAPDAHGYLTKVMEEAPTLYNKNFPNARFVRNFYEDCEQFMSNRVTEKFGGITAVPGTAGLNDLTTLEQVDLEQAYKKQRETAQLAAGSGVKKNPIGFLQQIDD